MKEWDVKYEHLEDKATRHPFWKRSLRVRAETRAEAIDQVKAMFPPPRYGNYKASVVK